MAKVRDDLIGAIHTDGHVLWAGDDIPAEVVIHESLIAADAPAPKTPAKRKPRAKKAEPEPDTDDGAIDA